MSEPTKPPFQPYVADDTRLPEFTLVVLVLGIFQALFFGMADAYLALKIGLTVGASIPAAVISMSILRGVLKRNSILENNLVQNMASVGESLACGAAFTIPALYRLQKWANDSGQPQPFNLDILQVYFVACMGGMMGILFMIPLRRYLIVKEHGVLPYPEGTACAEVLIAGDRGGNGAVTVFMGIFVAGVYRAAMSCLRLFRETVSYPVKALSTTVSFDLLPSLLAVGFILGIETCGVMLAGGLLGWFVFIPLIIHFGHDLTTPIAPALEPISALGPKGVYENYLKYIGAGAVTLGGLISLLKALPTIFDSAVAAGRALRQRAGDDTSRTARDIPLRWVLAGWFGVFLLIGLNRGLNVSGFLGAGLTVLFAFFFVTVSSRIVGLVGTTSMPLSGMTIGSLLVTCYVVKWAGFTGGAGMAAALVVAAMVCIAISMGGDISQDLKIGYLVGATPQWVQITQLISVLCSSAVVCQVIRLLMPQVLSGELEAPQSTLLLTITQGVMEGTLPWVPVMIGMCVAACVEMMGIGSLPFAIGMYLPLEVTTPLIFGGLINYFFARRFPGKVKAIYDHGLLLCSGFVAGDALVGVGVAIMATRQLDEVLAKRFSVYWFTQSNEVALTLFFGLCGFLVYRLWSFARSSAATESANE